MSYEYPGGCGQAIPSDNGVDGVCRAGTVRAHASDRASCDTRVCRNDDCSHTGGAGCGPAAARARGTDGYTCTGHPNTC